MVMGGIPFYLMKIGKNLSATQIIETLAFKQKSFLLDEFDNLYASLFNNSEVFIEIIREIASFRYGVGQEDLLKKIGKTLQGKGGIEKLKALQDANFIMSFKALNLSPTAIPSTWRYVPKKGSNEQGAQIDLLFDRDDDAITICEIKYSDKAFVITKEYAKKLQRKLEIFKRVTRTNKQLFIALISANGIKKNKYSDDLLSEVVTLADLFNE